MSPRDRRHAFRGASWVAVVLAVRLGAMLLLAVPLLQR